MLKGKKTFITPEIPNSFSCSLKELSIFKNSELIVTSDWVGHDLGHEEVLLHVQSLSPTLVITSDRILAGKIEYASKCKIFLIDEEYQSMLQNWIFELKAFLVARNQVFIF